MCVILVVLIQYVTVKLSVYTQHLINNYYYSLISFTNFNAQFLYSLTICKLHYNP